MGFLRLNFMYSCYVKFQVLPIAGSVLASYLGPYNISNNTGHGNRYKLIKFIVHWTVLRYIFLIFSYRSIIHILKYF